MSQGGQTPVAAQKTEAHVSAGAVPPAAQLAPAETNPFLQMQRTVGNQAVLNMIRTSAIQPKLTISQPGDPFEQEAERVADQVMRMPLDESLSSARPQIQRQCSACAAGGAPCSKCAGEEDDLHIHRKPNTSATAAHPSVPGNFLDHLGLGQPLDTATRAYFEPRFGRDFSSVRIHTGSDAADSARAINARAFTLSRDIVFASGEYQPATAPGLRLLSHELTHTIQQSGGAHRATPNATTSSEKLPRSTASTAPSITGHPAGVHREEEKSSPVVSAVGSTLADYWLPLPAFAKVAAIDYAIDLGIQTVDYFPGREVVGPLWFLFREGLLGFYNRLKTAAQDTKILVVDKIAKIISGKDKAFTWAFLKGLLKGFFIDGALGIFVVLWELIKGISSVWDFLKGIGHSIGGFPDSIRSILESMNNRGIELINGIGPAIEELRKSMLDPSRSGSLSDLIAEKSKGFARQGGAKIAEKLLDFFASAEIGETVGDVLGMALWEVVFALLTAGAGGIITAIKEGTSTFAKILAKVVTGVLKVVEEIKLFFGKIVEAVKEAIAFVRGKLKELSTKLVELFEDAGKLLERLLKGCLEHSPVVCNLEGAGDVAGSGSKVSTKAGAAKGPKPGSAPFDEPLTKAEQGLTREQLRQKHILEDQAERQRAARTASKEEANTAAQTQERGKVGAGMKAKPKHHVFPQEERAWFEERGFTGEFDIDKFTVEIEEAEHQAVHGGGDYRLGRSTGFEWNRRVMAALRSEEAGLGRRLRRRRIFEIVQNLMEEYRIPHEFVPY